ncbi:hypothetical protein [Candidatus Marimicrobium litorale]|uniref:Hydrazine synthase alpha subunit middle domain-containing protein n=1 Tax=Candidatus Marimicrobium litorale TaxID=2518991 RepID=A0ABT3T5S8_9GAMM|nr:hypothetical protein [Candidatus Marimicrobium litorale]MCX2977619.1 hypothetical protein [Candidatus Marimicrobium litorale]
MTRLFSLLLLFFAPLGAVAAPAGDTAQSSAPTAAVQSDWKLVYTRQPLATKPVPGARIDDAANWQHATDVGRINGGIAEADIVIDDLKGNVKVVYNCTTSEEICVAHEARVSPDGTKIVYSVGEGARLVEVQYLGVKMGIYDIPRLRSARLWIYDLVTGENTPIPHHPAKAIDRQPEWLTNDKIVFVSNRSNTYPFKFPWPTHRGTDQYGRNRCFNPPACHSQDYGYDLSSRSLQLWTMNIDGTDAKNISPHENMALAPTVMSNGDIVYSCWNAHENKTYDAYTPRAGTVKNKWWLCRTDGNGADTTVLLNGHKSPTIKTRDFLPQGTHGGEGRSQLRALRSAAEIFKDRLAVTNYYRANHVGSMGIIYGMDYGDPHVEGCSRESCQTDPYSANNWPGSGRYIPSSFVPLTPYGNDQDMDVRFNGKGQALGKAGYPAPLPDTDKEYMITHARGSCYEITPLEQATRKAMGGEPTCQKAIYRVKAPMVIDPFDKRQMEFMAGGPDWQAFDARAIATFQQLHGQPAPDRPAPLDPNVGCYLQVVDARKAELYPSAKRYSWKNNLYQQCAFQGCAVNTENPGFYAKNVANLAVLLPEMWDIRWQGKDKKEYEDTINSLGHKSIASLGAQPLEADGSVKMRVPCDTPLIMAGTDANGMAIAHDAMLHSLRPGETRTCHGCHDGHSEERAAKLKHSAVERFEDTLAYNTNPPMPEASPPVTFADVAPILKERCASCHREMGRSDTDRLYYSVAQDYQQFDWPRNKPKSGHGEHGRVVNVKIRHRGKGYAVGETLKFGPGGAAGKIARVGPKGQINAIRMTAPGDGYPRISSIKVNTEKGRGAVLQAMTDKMYLSRPYTSKWTAKFARDSLLYWKCVGSRQDGRSDGQYPDDIDFGPAHEAHASAQECQVIGRWIDHGVQN